MAGWILEVDRGSLLPYKGNYSAWLLQKQNRLDMEHSKQVRADVLAAQRMPFQQPCRGSLHPPIPQLSRHPPSLSPSLHCALRPDLRKSSRGCPHPPSFSSQAQIAKRLESELEWIRNGRASVSKARAKNYEKAMAERKEGAAKLQQLSEGRVSRLRSVVW